MCFFYRGRWKKPKCLQYLLRRRPYAIIPHLQQQIQSSEQLFEQRTKCIKGKNKCNRCVISVHRKKVKTSLMQIVQILLNKSQPVANSITSPRKRILKELERVTIDDLSLKRSKGKTQGVQVTSTASPQQVTAETVVVSTIETNGNSNVVVKEEEPSSKATSSKNSNSYSINSLLKNDKKDDSNKLSSQFVPVHRMTHHKEPSYDTVDSHRIDVIVSFLKILTFLLLLATPHAK